MPRGRSNSRTPSKKLGTVSSAPDQPSEPETLTKGDDVSKKSSLGASTPKRRRGQSASTEEDSLTRLPLPSQSSSRRSRPPANSGKPSREEVDSTTVLSNSSLKKAKDVEKGQEQFNSSTKLTKQADGNSSNSKTQKDETTLKSPTLEEEITSPPATTLDVTVHRVRHLDYIPTSVLAIATSSSLVAISRQDGSLEILETTFIQDYGASTGGGKTKWSPHLFPLATIAGSKRAVAHSLAFVGATGDDSHHSTLVAGSPDGTLWTVQFAGQPRQFQSRIASGGGGVFDLTTCRDDSAHLSSLVAGACQDGSIRIWQLFKNQDTGLVKIQEPPVATLSTTGAPVLSVAWRCEKKVGDIFHTVIFAGVADGTIRKYYMQLQSSDLDGSIQCLKHKSDLRMTIESRGRRTPTKIWTMESLTDGSLVTGNSLGQIQIFDTNTGTLLQSVNQTELKADVLRVTVNASQTKIFASGVDSRVVCLERSSATPVTDPSGSGWKFTTAQRPHTHDVKAMAVIQGKVSNGSTLMEALITGGVDTKLCTYLVSDFAKKRPQVLYPWPSQSPVSSTMIGDNGGDCRMLSIHRDNKIELYRLDNEQQASKRQSQDTPKSISELVAEIALETQSNLALSALCPNGKWLAAANATKLFVFRLTTDSKIMATGRGSHEEKMDVDIQPEKVALPKPLDQLTVTAIHFSSSNTLLVADSSHRLFVVDLSNGHAKIASTMQVHPGDEGSKLPICSIKASSDNTFVVAMIKTEKDGGIHVFRRTPDESDEYAHCWTIPGLAGSRPAAITMVGKSHVAVATVSFQIYVFDIESQKLSPWSEDNKFPIEKWPTEISHRKDFPVRLFVNPDDDTQLIMVRFALFLWKLFLLIRHAQDRYFRQFAIFPVFCWLVTLARLIVQLYFRPIPCWFFVKPIAGLV